MFPYDLCTIQKVKHHEMVMSCIKRLTELGVAVKQIFF